MDVTIFCGKIDAGSRSECRRRRKRMKRIEQWWDRCPTMAKVVLLTSLWAIPLLVLLLCADDHAGEPAIEFQDYHRRVWWGSTLLFLLLLWGAYRATRYIPPQPANLATSYWYQDAVLVALLVMWALLPPSYFFVEYFAFDQKLIAFPAGSDGVAHKDLLAARKNYADFASKVWGGASAVFAAVLAMTKPKSVADRSG